MLCGWRRQCGPVRGNVRLRRGYLRQSGGAGDAGGGNDCLSSERGGGRGHTRIELD